MRYWADFSAAPLVAGATIQARSGQVAGLLRGIRLPTRRPAILHAMRQTILLPVLAAMLAEAYPEYVPGTFAVVSG